MSPKRQPATITAIATALNISAATVSNALSGKGRVSPKLVARIRETASELGYVPSQAARALRTGRAGVIGLVLPDISNPFFPQLAQAIEWAAGAAGYGVLITDARDDIAHQAEAIGRLVERGVDGLVVVPRRGSRIGDIGVPLAVIDSLSAPGNTVSADHRDAGKQMGRHLRSLGHRRVLLIGQSGVSNVQNDRVAGLKTGLGDHVLSQTLWVEELEQELGAGCRLGLAEKVAVGFTAFAATSDLLALRALTELQQNGVEVPRHASVSGFDDLVWSAVVTPSLTTLRQNIPEIAERAIEALNHSISGADAQRQREERQERPWRNGIGVAMQLLVRQSTAPVQQAGAAGQEASG